MQKLWVTAVLCGMWVSVANAEDYAAPLGKMELQDGDSIVFLGDSITHQCLYTQYIEDYFYTRFPKMRLKLHNAGVGGARAWDALQRFDDDVAAYQPKYVTILLGMNDGTYIPYDDATFQTYRQDMTKIVEQLQEIHSVPILMTPTMFDARAARMNPRRQREADSVALYNSVLAYYGTWCREIAAEQGLGFVDMWSPLNNITLEERKQNPTFTLIADAVHPDAPGQVVMATAMVEHLGLDRRVSNIRISKQADGTWKGTGPGGKLTDLQPTEDGLSFVWHANSLPWVLPENAEVGVRLTRLGHRFSGEMLEFHGLDAGTYELSIDGNVVGKYTSDVLGRHIELQGNSKTPQYQQALAVAMKNQERNDQAVRPLRNEWRIFQQFARIKREAGNQPENEELQKQLASLTERVQGLTERVAEHQAKAQAFEDEIFTMNQPPARTYELKRVK